MFKVATVATVLALALRASAFGITTPPSATACTELTFDITNGNPSDQYSAYIVHADDPCGPEIDRVDNISGNNFKWMVKVSAGTKIMVALDNGRDDEQWSGGVEVSGTDTSCVTGSTTAEASSTSSTGSTTRAATFTAPVNAASSAPSSTAGSTSGTSRATFGIFSALAVLGAAAVGLTL